MQAQWKQSFCLCISEGQDEGCQGTTAAKANKHLHSIILSEKKKLWTQKSAQKKVAANLFE